MQSGEHRLGTAGSPRALGERIDRAWSVACRPDGTGRVRCTFRSPGDAEIWAHTPRAPLLSPERVQTVGDGRRGWILEPSAAGPPKPRPRYLAACSARSVSRANWSVPKKSTRQGGFSRTRVPPPSSPPGDPPSPDSARHWGPDLPPAPPPAGRCPQQRRTRTLIASAGGLPCAGASG